MRKQTVEEVMAEAKEEYIRLQRIDAVLDRIQDQLDNITKQIQIERHRNFVENVLNLRNVR